MATYQIPIVAGVFNEEVQAKNAVDALRGASFGRDQIGVAMQSSGPAVDRLSQDLMNLGVEENRASYYYEECKAGHIVISVRPDGRDDVVRHILVENGAHDYGQEQHSENSSSVEEAQNQAQN